MERSVYSIYFTKKAKKEAVDFLVAELERNKWKVSFSDGENRTLLIHPTLEGLYLSAERYFLYKKCNSVPPFQPFNSDVKELFINIENGVDFFTPAEQLLLIKKDLDNLRAGDKDSIIPGHPEAELYPGKSILRRFISSELIEEHYSLHDREDLDKLRASWLRNKMNIINQPLKMLDEYFGIELGLYFSFVETYARALVALVLVIFANMALDLNPMLTSVLVIAWSFCFILVWRRSQVDRAYKKGILNTVERGWEEARPEHFGKLSRNEITGKQEPAYDLFKQKLRILASYCATALCCYASYLIMEYYYSWEKYAYAEYGINSYTAMLPGIVYTVIVIITSQKYRQFARKLTNFENHRTESSFQKNLLVKLLVFEFINNFLVLYLLAFIYEDLDMLRSTVITTMTISQVFVEIFEGVVPFAFYKSRTKNKKKSFTDLSEQADYEKNRDEYEGHFDEYLEIWIQFGYVVLFTSIYEYAPLCALLATIIEIRNDAHKFLNLFKRPESRIAESIGFWDDAFSLLAFLAIPTQIGLGKMMGLTTWKKAAIAEHLVIFLAVAVNRLRPCPAETQKQIDRDEYFRTHRHESNLLKKVQENKHD
ncbi:unnamed protein product [Oikopleura dioica]|uniref:Anoctamin n=1 Tax=Oikopleura dioica TaxID=34765 RepID=E4X5E5_OIKDI|nr:unnamed protein product [Oikopleura dioica]